MAYKILLVGGGTGGHVYPLVAVAEEIQKKAAQSGLEAELLFMGDGDLLKDVAQQIGVKFKSILSSKWRRYFSFQNFIDIFKFPLGFFQSLFNVWLFMPDVIFAKGGYASFLPTLAGKLMMIPIVIHESDSIPGKTNIFLGKLSKKVFLAFASAIKYFDAQKSEVVGNPIRSNLLVGADKAAALSAFALDPVKPTILITGASQGAKPINDVLLLSIVELAKKFQIIHQSGSPNYDDVSKQVLTIIKEGEALYGKDIQNNYRLYPVFDLAQMVLAYAAADVIISRAGSQIFEIAAIGKPSIVVPLKGSASNHQVENAREFSKFGATIIEEDNLTPHIFINEIEKAYEKRAELSEKIKKFAKPDAAMTIAEYLLNLGRI